MKQNLAIKCVCDRWASCEGLCSFFSLLYSCRRLYNWDSGTEILQYNLLFASSEPRGKAVDSSWTVWIARLLRASISFCKVVVASIRSERNEYDFSF